MLEAEEKKYAIYLSAASVSFSCIALQLIVATYAAFLWGSTIFQYALVFSITLAAIGVGSLLSQKFEDHPYPTFLVSKILTAVFVIFSIPILYYIFSLQIGSHFILILLTSIFGFLIGLEIPLLNTLRENESLTSQVMFYDYLGGFIGGLLFSSFLLPTLGFFRASALLALINLAIGLFFWKVFKIHLKSDFHRLKVMFIGFGILAFLYLVLSETVRRALELKFSGIQT